MEFDEIYENIYFMVEDACRKETNKFGYGIWSHHIVEVLKYGEVLAKKYNADIEVVKLAVLLHDYSSIKDYNNYAEHHIHSMNEAEQILEKFDFPKEKIELVKKCIFSHRGSVKKEKTTPEEICVTSADGISHITQVASLFSYVYKEKGLGIEDGKKWILNKIERTWNKLDNISKELIEENYYSAKKILE